MRTCAFTGSSSGLVGFESFDLSLEGWFRLAGAAVVAALIVASVVLSSDAGRVLSAMRDNDERCSYLGIDTSLVRIGLTVVAGVVAALAGYTWFLVVQARRQTRETRDEFAGAAGASGGWGGVALQLAFVAGGLVLIPLCCALPKAMLGRFRG